MLLQLWFVYQHQSEAIPLIQNKQSCDFDTLADKVSSLYNEKCQLEQFVSRFKNGNRNYLEIIGFAEQIVYGLLAEQGALLTSAIIAVVQALRVNSGKYAIIFDNSEYDNSSEYHEV